MDGLSLHPASQSRPAFTRRSSGAEGYRLGCLLGQGRAATVYLAEHRRHGGRVALKLPKLAAAARDPHGRRFALEGELLASIHDRHVVAVLEQRHDATAYLAMEVLDGGVGDAPDEHSAGFYQTGAERRACDGGRRRKAISARPG